MIQKLRTNAALRVWFFFLFFCFFLMSFSHILYGRYASLAVFVFCVFTTINILFTPSRLKNLFPHRNLEGRDPYLILSITQRISKELQLKAPNILICNTPKYISYSFGVFPQNMYLAISESLVLSLTPAETECLIIHECLKIKSSSSLKSSFVSALGYMISFLSEKIDLILFFQILKASNKRTRITEKLFAPFIALIGFVYAPIFYQHKIDQLTIEVLTQLKRDPKVYAQLLWKIDALMNTRPLDLRLGDSYLFTQNPFTNHLLSKYFLWNSSTKSRIRRLIGHYPI